MASALVAGDAVPSGATLLGDLLDRGAGAELACGSLNWRDGSGLSRDGRKGYEAGKCGNDDANVSLPSRPPEAVCVTTIETILASVEGLSRPLRLEASGCAMPTG